jgi:uncharacterized membrane protein
MRTVLLLHAAATLFMVGLIWFVQVVHYPLFAAVGEEGFARYETLHNRLTTWVVGPPMLVELAAALALVFRRPPEVPGWAAWLGLGLVGVIWLSTAFLQVPRHQRLTAGFDAAAHGALVTTNWLRTVAWTLRGGLALWMVR